MKIRTSLKSSKTIELISALLILFFTYNGIMSLINIGNLKNLLAFYTLERSQWAWSIILAELLVAFFLLFPKTRRIGFFATILFCISLCYTISKTPYFPHEFGGILNRLSNQQQIYFSVILSSMAMLGIWLSYKQFKRKSSPTNITAYI